MASPTPISGFPEWLPAERIAEQQVLDNLREVFELHGFASIQTRAVEPLDQLLRKGETSKEVYTLRRLQAEDGDDSDSSSTLGLHFDLTVPFARYVLENAGKLQFPFRRYQIQPAWRGERPQEGRYREFVQADIDVIDKDALSFHYEVEIAQVIAAAFARLPLPPVRLQVNNRKLIEGYYRGIGVDDVAEVMRIVDKLDKIGAAGVEKTLVEDLGLSGEQARACLALAEISGEDARIADEVAALGVHHPLLDEGLDELVRRAGRHVSRCAAAPSRWLPILPSRAGSTTTPGPSTRRACRGSSTSARSAREAATTRSRATAGRRTPESASPSVSRGRWRRCSPAVC